ncbi:MAG: dipeptide epimerase [Saccharofermentanales bacterium]|nr:dipeptide epimerase [Bacillota bacterium]
MKITAIRLATLSVPLKTPFKTAVRTVESIKNLIIEIHTDSGHIGYGEAPPTGLVTGDTMGANIAAIKEHIAPSIVGKSIKDFDELLCRVYKSIQHNTSAKAAVDMALFDLFAQSLNVPLYRILGGDGKAIETDITISVNEPEEMVRDSLDAVKRGYQTLKIKVGKDANKDIERMTKIREAIGFDAALRIDANQGWKPKEAVTILNEMDRSGLDIEFVEQPVIQQDIAGLKYVTEHVMIPVMADESVYSPQDANQLLINNACDMINIKLMKTGGLRQALQICNLAEMYNVECMLGCMLETKVSITAAVHLASARRNIITKIDLDGPVLCAEDPIEGGAVFEEANISLSDEPGLGIKRINGLVYID